MSGGDNVVKLTGMRGTIAQKMHASVQETAQLSFHTDCDAGALIAARQAWKQSGTNIGYEDLIIHALASLIAELPHLNAREDEPRQITQCAGINVSVAVSLPNGLVAPALCDVQDLSVQEISAARRDLVERAGRGKLSVDEMTRGTITVSNLGQTRVHYFSPILNRPQVAIFGLGRIRKAVTVNYDDEVVIRPLMGLSLTVDHRVIDGAPAGEALSRLCELLETSPALPE